MVPIDDVRVAIGCASLTAFALGFLLGARLCERKVRSALHQGTEVGHQALGEYRRRLEVLKPGDWL